MPVAHGSVGGAELEDKPAAIRSVVVEFSGDENAVLAAVLRMFGVRRFWLGDFVPTYVGARLTAMKGSVITRHGTFHVEFAYYSDGSTSLFVCDGE
ncbi:MAG: hypothetical protein QXN23_06030 [Candidatus Caldarchaeum sp.]